MKTYRKGEKCRKKVWYRCHADDYYKISDAAWYRINKLDGLVNKPTLKSAERWCQNAANLTGHPYCYYISKYRKDKKVKAWVVFPNEDDCFVEMI